MLQLIGLTTMQIMSVFSHLQFNMKFCYLNVSQIGSQVLHLLKPSPRPSLITSSFVELMYGVALSLCWILVFKMGTRFLSETRHPGKLGLWGILPNAMVCNLQTNHVSPQFHLIHDDNFNTIINNLPMDHHLSDMLI